MVVLHRALIATLALVITAGAAQASANCRYENAVGDRVYFEQYGADLHIKWSADDQGHPDEAEETCATEGTGTGFFQRTAECPNLGNQLYGFGGKTLRATTVDTLAFYGFVWFKICN